MGIQAPAEVKYRLIQEVTRQDDNRLNISALCRIAGVSRSGYYAWIEAAALRKTGKSQIARIMRWLGRPTSSEATKKVPGASI